MKSYDIAISYLKEDSWLAKDLHGLLTMQGISVFTYETSPDAASNVFSLSLLNIYKQSSINILIWSEHYKNSDKASTVKAELNALHSRHIGKSEQQSLVIIAADDTSIHDDFETCPMHKVKIHGVLNVAGIVVNRLMQNWKISTHNKFYQHPKGCKNRSPMSPCTFKIKNTYAGTKRWVSLADIDVTVNNKSIHKNGMKVYLIPSGLTPPFVNHSVSLKSNTNFLDIKRRIAIDFIKANLNRELDGVLFNIKTEVELPHIYSKEFDKYILDNWHNYTKEPLN